MTRKNNHTAAAESQTGYKHPPVKSRFKKGRSGNPRGRPKESRNVDTVLSEVLNQQVTFKAGGRAKPMNKGDALIKRLLNMASKGDRRAVDAVINFLGKIERLVEQPEAERKDVGVMLVPGVLTPEEYDKKISKWARDKELEDQQRQADAPMLARKEAALRGIIARYKGSPEADAAAICLVELLRANQFNFYIKHQTEEELEKEQPLGCYRRPFNTAMWSSVGWGHLFPEGSPLLPKRRNDKQSET
jgi:Family of unknown function (DUF5681)